MPPFYGSKANQTPRPVMRKTPSTRLMSRWPPVTRKKDDSNLKLQKDVRDQIGPSAVKSKRSLFESQFSSSERSSSSTKPLDFESQFSSSLRSSTKPLDRRFDLSKSVSDRYLTGSRPTSQVKLAIAGFESLSTSEHNRQSNFLSGKESFRKKDSTWRTNYRIRYKGPTVLRLSKVYGDHSNLPESNERNNKDEGKQSILTGPSSQKRRSYKFPNSSSLHSSEADDSDDDLEDYDDFCSDSEECNMGEKIPMEEEKRPEVWITPAKPRNNWKVKRVWGQEEADAMEPEHLVPGEKLTETINDLLGVPESTGSGELEVYKEGKADDNEKDNSSSPFYLKMVYDVGGEIVESETDDEQSFTRIEMDKGIQSIVQKHLKMVYSLGEEEEDSEDEREFTKIHPLDSENNHTENDVGQEMRATARTVYGQGSESSDESCSDNTNDVKSIHEFVSDCNLSTAHGSQLQDEDSNPCNKNKLPITPIYPNSGVPPPRAEPICGTSDSNGKPSEDRVLLEDNKLSSFSGQPEVRGDLDELGSRVISPKKHGKEAALWFNGPDARANSSTGNLVDLSNNGKATCNQKPSWAKKKIESLKREEGNDLSNNGKTTCHQKPFWAKQKLESPKREEGKEAKLWFNDPEVRQNRSTGDIGASLSNDDKISRSRELPWTKKKLESTKKEESKKANFNDPGGRQNRSTGDLGASLSNDDKISRNREPPWMKKKVGLPKTTESPKREERKEASLWFNKPERRQNRSTGELGTSKSDDKLTRGRESPWTKKKVDTPKKEERKEANLCFNDAGGCGNKSTGDPSISLSAGLKKTLRREFSGIKKEVVSSKKEERREPKLWFQNPEGRSHRSTGDLDERCLSDKGTNLSNDDRGTHLLVSPKREKKDVKLWFKSSAITNCDGSDGESDSESDSESDDESAFDLNKFLEDTDSSSSSCDPEIRENKSTGDLERGRFYNLDRGESLSDDNGITRRLEKPWTKMKKMLSPEKERKDVKLWFNVSGETEVFSGGRTRDLGSRRGPNDGASSSDDEEVTHCRKRLGETKRNGRRAKSDCKGIGTRYPIEFTLEDSARTAHTDESSNSDDDLDGRGNKSTGELDVGRFDNDVSWGASLSDDERISRRHKATSKKKKEKILLPPKKDVKLWFMS